MKLKNPFSQETKALFLYSYNCFNCNKGTNSRDPHHILGRVSDSPLNCSPVCIECHEEEHQRSRLDKGKLLVATIKYLVKYKYDFTEKDIEFYNKHKKLYEDIKFICRDWG